MALAPISNPFQDLFNANADKYGIDRTWFSSLGQVESTFDPNATSPAGAQGLLQLMPATGASVGVTNPYDPAQNVAGGAAYFSQMLAKAGGDYPTAVQYYNCGPGNTCPAGVDEANKVASLVAQQGGGTTAGGRISSMWNTLQGDITGNTSPATPNYTKSGFSWGGLAGSAGFIIVGALLVILAMVIPNRKLVVQTVGAVS